MSMFTLILEHSWNTRPYLLGVEHLCTQGERIYFIPECPENLSLAPTPQKGPCHVMFVGILHTEDHKELNTCEFKSQDSRKKKVCNRRFTHSIFVVSDDDLGENVVSVLGSYDTCSQCFTSPLSIFVTMSLSKPIGVVRVNTWTRMLTSAVKTFILKLWDSSGTTSTWSLLRSM